MALPALNEAASITTVIADVQALYPDYDILVVDDGSTDSTAQHADAAGAMVCRLPFRLGVGGAMRTAYKFAKQHDYGIVVQVDADGQHDAAFIGDLVSRLGQNDLVIGARFAGVGAYHTAAPRRLAMKLLARVMSRIAHRPLSDVTSGFRAAGPRCVDLFAAHYPAEYLGDTVESLVIALRTGCSVDQVPVEMRHRAGGLPSQSPLRAALYLVRAVIALALALVRQWPVPEDIRAADLTVSRSAA